MVSDMLDHQMLIILTAFMGAVAVWVSVRGYNRSMRSHVIEASTWRQLIQDHKLRRYFLKRLLTILALMTGVYITGYLFLEVRLAEDEAEVRKVVKDSQEVELGLFIRPDTAEEDTFRKYWVPSERGGVAVERIKNELKSLRAEGRRYGEESKMELFEINSVHIEKGMAEVRTTERWYLPTYDANNNRVVERNSFLGPYNLTYVLRKTDDRWLIQEVF